MLRSSTTPATQNAFDAAGRLRAGVWIDVEVATEEVGVDIPSAYLNVIAVVPNTSGYLSVYPPNTTGDRPATSTLNYQKSVTIANQAFVAVRNVFGRYAARIFTSGDTHVVLDLTGVTLRGTVPLPLAAQTEQQRTSNTRAKSRTKAASLPSRLRSSLAERVRKSLTAR